MNKHYRKMIAPIVIAIIMVFYYMVFFLLLMHSVDTVWKYLLGIIPLVLASLIIFVCFERIKEIKKGEEDDISKY